MQLRSPIRCRELSRDHSPRLNGVAWLRTLTRMGRVSSAEDLRKYLAYRDAYYFESLLFLYIRRSSSTHWLHSTVWLRKPWSLPAGHLSFGNGFLPLMSPALQSLTTNRACSLVLGIDTTGSSNRFTLIASPIMSHESILEEFRRRLQQDTRTATCGRQFVLVEKLQQWLRSPADGVVTHAERLLRVAYEDRCKAFLPIAAPQIVLNPGEHCCLLVLCILQLIGCGSAIHVFYENQKTDGLLPFRQDTIQELFRDANIQDPNKATEFFEMQHRFKPARFELQMKNIWRSDRVIPIYRKNSIKEGGTAQVYQIDIPEEFVGERLRDFCAGSRFNAASEESPDWVRCRPIPSSYVPLFCLMHGLVTTLSANAMLLNFSDTSLPWKPSCPPINPFTRMRRKPS